MIWTGQRLQPDEPLYNMALSFRIRGRIDHAAFRAAFQSLINGCDSLRTTFDSVGGVPMQRVHERFDYNIDLIDLSAAPDTSAALANWQHERISRCTELEKRTFDSALLRLATDDFVWYFNQHHVAADAWSTAVIYRAMQDNYRLALDERLADARALPEFREFVDFEAAERDSKRAQRAAQYWRRRLAVSIPPSSFYRATPRDRSGRTLRTPCALGVERTATIKALATGREFGALTEDLARFQIFVTALFGWLHRVSGNRVLSVGVPCHNRGSARHKNTAGLFIEIYPLLVEIDADESFASLYIKVADATRELLINAPPGASNFEHNRAYDVVLNYITASFGDFAGMPMQSQWLHPDHGDRNHLLRMQVEDFDNADELRVFFDLNEDVFPGDERQRPGRQFLRVMDALLTRPGEQIATVDLLTASERTTFRNGFAPASPAPVPAHTVFDMFSTQVANTPDAVAIACDDEALSFAQLAERVDVLARRLAAAGVRRGMRVAIILPRCTDAVVAMLAAWRCGAAYVPVDPAYPAARIALMLADADARLVLTLSDCAPGQATGAPTINVDDPGSPADNADPTQEIARCHSGDTAYIIYTSGSTGRPKGVEVGHRGLANYIAWAGACYLQGQRLSWPLFSTLSFDLTVTSIFVPLAHGGRIVVYAERPGEREITIRRVVEDNRVDIVKLTPAHLSLLQAMDLSASRLRALIVGGEDLKTELARSISHYFGDRVDIYNEYGPTEGTVACMIHRFDPGRDGGSSVPIGRAIDNAYVYVVNDAGELQPDGVIGELCIGGAGVARGYLNRADLTAERFIDNPLRPGEKMYRTGDLARSNPDATLTCLGRADHQFKINGVRVEPAEIEAALLALPEIGDAAVRLIENTDNAAADAFCVKCGLSGKHPGAVLDADSVCKICAVYEADREQALAYFGTLDDLRAIVATIKASAAGKYDCMMLLSGGKDSTFALCQLVDLGLTPLVFTLDNGFISEGAKTNMRRVVKHLGLELIAATTPAMNEIFADSLRRFSNVCNGCFKTIYTLSMKVAREHGIRHIFTGLSRGQIFETRVADLFRQRIYDPQTIDATIIEARKAYHRADDAVSRLLDVRHFEDDAIFDDVQFVDFYRYTDVSLGDMLEYLGDRVPWVRPADTGRSTNCLINEAGIYVHKKERGFHNYSLPYSWDVRLGHKQRDMARDELDDDINVSNVRRILGEIGYTPREETTTSRRTMLAAYYVAPQDIDHAALRAHMESRLPREFVPAWFIRLDSLPLTPNGKVDRDALPHPDMTRPQLADAYVAPGDPAEETLANIWSQVFGLDRVGVNDNFFDLGGDSIINIQIVALAAKHGMQLSAQQVFEYPTVAELVAVAGTSGQLASEQGPVTGAVTLTPIQRRFFEQAPAEPKLCTQYVFLETRQRLDALVAEEALRQILVHHDALRSRFVHDSRGWRQEILDAGSAAVPITAVDLTGADEDACEAAFAAHLARLQNEMDFESGALVRAALFDHGPERGSTLLLAIHHLVMDALSWWVLIEDMEFACRRIAAGEPFRLAPKTTSVRHFGDALVRYAATSAAVDTLPLWRESRVRDSVPDLPADDGLQGSNDLASVATESMQLTPRETRALTTDVAAGWRAQPQDLMIAALLMTLPQWSGADALAIEFEGHGREQISDELDLQRTVGWFTTIYPLFFRTAARDEDSADLVRRVRDKLRAVPNGGIAYGALRYLGADDSLRSELAGCGAQVLFNYLGKWQRQAHADSMFSLARPLMASFGTHGPRQYLLEINATIFDARLQIDWSYSKNVHHPQTIAHWARRFRDNLRQLIDYCAGTADHKYTPLDFPSAAVSQGELDDILSEFGES